MAEQPDGAIWPRGYWRTWQPIIGATYATTLTRLRAWSTLITGILYLFAAVLLAYYLIFVRTGSLLATTIAMIVPWAIVVAIIEYQRVRLPAHWCATSPHTANRSPRFLGSSKCSSCGGSETTS